MRNEIRARVYIGAALTVGVAALALAACLLALHGHGEPMTGSALKAAGGFNDVKPIEGMSHFIDALKGNLAWLLITGLILVVLILGGLFFVGNSNAHRYAVNVLIGAAIVGCAGGIVA